MRGSAGLSRIGGAICLRARPRSRLPPLRPDKPLPGHPPLVDVSRAPCGHAPPVPWDRPDPPRSCCVVRATRYGPGTDCPAMARPIAFSRSPLCRHSGLIATAGQRTYTNHHRGLPLLSAWRQAEEAGRWRGVSHRAASQPYIIADTRSRAASAGRLLCPRRDPGTLGPDRQISCRPEETAGSGERSPHRADRCARPRVALTERAVMTPRSARSMCSRACRGGGCASPCDAARERHARGQRGSPRFGGGPGSSALPYAASVRCVAG